MVDRVRPLKLEDPSSGGTETDESPTSLDHNQDYIDARGVTLQDATSDDDAVRVERSAGVLVLRDTQFPSGKTLSSLAEGATGISETTHRALRQLIHFIDDGPADGFSSGAFKETLPAGQGFPARETWWEDNSKQKKIVELEILRDGRRLPTSEIWSVYAQDGVTVLATVTDTITYDRVFETTRTRTVTTP